MTVREIETMRELQRRYYQELRGVGAGRLVRCPHNPQVLFLYRLCLLFTLGFIFAFFVHKF